jgi:hypothetical protein
MSEYFHLLGNPAHWLFEFTVEGVTFLILTYPARKWIKRHDKEHHAEKH